MLPFLLGFSYFYEVLKISRGKSLLRNHKKINNLKNIYILRHNKQSSDLITPTKKIYIGYMNSYPTSQILKSGNTGCNIAEDILAV